MTKVFLMLAGLASMFLVGPNTRAANVAGSFNVTVKLTSLCGMVAANNLALGSYTAYQTGSLRATPITATLSCNRGFSGFSASLGSVETGSTAAAIATNTVGAGVLAGLKYEITATPDAVMLGTAVMTDDLAAYERHLYTIPSNIQGDQAGALTSKSQTQLWTLTITY
jgi:hypothetical protein